MYPRSIATRQTFLRTSVLTVLVLVVPALVMATGAAPSSGSSPETTRIITDALGRQVVIPSQPTRMVVAGNAALMVADALYLFDSAPERIVGITKIGQARGNFLAALDPRYADKVVFERNSGPEQVAAVSPDLVFLKSFMKQRLGDGIERLGIPVVYVDLETPEQYQRDLSLLGEILGEPARAAALTRYYQDAVTAVSARTSVLPGDRLPRVLFLYANSSGGDIAFNVPPNGWIQTTLVEFAGGVPVWRSANTGKGWLTVSFEQIAAWDPDKIFLVSYRSNPDEIRADLVVQERWQALRAVQTGDLHVFPVDYYSWDQPDTRWILGLQWLATRMHPDLFSDIDMGQVTYGFFGFAYGMQKADTDRLILEPLWGALR